MIPIRKQYIVNEKGQKIAVQIDLKTFEEIERLLEDYALGKLIQENSPNDNLTLEEAKAYYKGLSKAD